LLIPLAFQKIQFSMNLKASFFLFAFLFLFIKSGEGAWRDRREEAKDEAKVHERLTEKLKNESAIYKKEASQQSSSELSEILYGLAQACLQEALLHEKIAKDYDGFNWNSAMVYKGQAETVQQRIITLKKKAGDLGYQISKSYDPQKVNPANTAFSNKTQNLQKSEELKSQSAKYKKDAIETKDKTLAEALYTLAQACMEEALLRDKIAQSSNQWNNAETYKTQLDAVSARVNALKSKATSLGYSIDQSKVIEASAQNSYKSDEGMRYAEIKLNILQKWLREFSSIPNENSTEGESIRQNLIQNLKDESDQLQKLVQEMKTTQVVKSKSEIKDAFDSQDQTVRDLRNQWDDYKTKGKTAPPATPAKKEIVETMAPEEFEKWLEETAKLKREKQRKPDISTSK
jgi:hypothetical protein